MKIQNWLLIAGACFAIGVGACTVNSDSGGDTDSDPDAGTGGSGGSGGSGTAGTAGVGGDTDAGIDGSGGTGLTDAGSCTGCAEYSQCLDASSTTAEQDACTEAACGPAVTLYNAYVDCICGTEAAPADGACSTECASSACAGTPATSGDPCDTCIQDATGTAGVCSVPTAACTSDT